MKTKFAITNVNVKIWQKLDASVYIYLSMLVIYFSIMHNIYM